MTGTVTQGFGVKCLAQEYKCDGSVLFQGLKQQHFNNQPWKCRYLKIINLCMDLYIFLKTHNI